FINIGVIGPGVMGSSIVRHLLKAGYEVNVYNRTKSKAIPLTEEGAVWKNTPAEIAEKSEVILTIVGYPIDVQKVYFGENGIFEGLSEGKIITDMTTSTPAHAEKLAEETETTGDSTRHATAPSGDLGTNKGTPTA